MVSAIAEEVLLSLIRIDGGTQPRAEVNSDVVQEYAQQMLEGVKFPQVVIFYDGTDYWLADGFHRYYAAKQSGLEAINADIRQGTRRDAVLYSVGANSTHGLRRTNADKRRAVETLLRDEEWGKWSDSEIARHCDVSVMTVGRIKRDLIFNNVIDSPSEKLVQRNGTIYAMNTSNIGSDFLTKQIFHPMNAAIIQPIDNREESLQKYVSDVADKSLFYSQVEEEEGRIEYQQSSIEVNQREILQYEEVKKGGVPPALQMSESNEWYTPSQYVEAARELMGGIDVDPASNAYANEKVIHAATYHDIITNGLTKEWTGRVWLNPPYGREGGDSNQEIWTRRLIEQYEAGITIEAVLLVNANTEAKWFQPLYNYPICLTNHRIRFYNMTGDSSQPTQGNTFVYFGKQIGRFVEIFSTFGNIVFSMTLVQGLGGLRDAGF